VTLAEKFAAHRAGIARITTVPKMNLINSKIGDGDLFFVLAETTSIILGRVLMIFSGVCLIPQFSGSCCLPRTLFSPAGAVN
jgi:hypothetical protein